MTSAASKQLRGGRYTLIRKLGEGSQGETYEATDNGRRSRDPRDTSSRRSLSASASHDAPLADKWVRYVRDQRTGGDVPRSAELVAIKCFRVGTAKSWKDVELAEREARTLASLDHPRLPRYFEHFEEDGALYLVMQKIEGESLATIRKERRSMSATEVTRMLEDIGGALRYLHGRAPAVVHRDIKPGNIIRKPDGSFALVDFGAVRDRLKPAGGSTVVGTFGFMAPEQFQGRASARSDLYGLGATAITMLTGEDPEDLPHEGLGIDVERAVAKGARGTPKELVRVLTAMLVADPDGRIESADAILGQLRDARSGGNDEGRDQEDSRDDNRRNRKRNARGSAGAPRLSRKQQRALAKQQEAASRREQREQRRQGRVDARARRPPFVFQFFGRLGLLVAQLVVWATVGFAVPVVLILLSLLFGSALRRAAAACMNAARRSQSAIGRASRRLSGHRVDTPRASASSPKVRVVAEPEGIRAVVDADEVAAADAPAEDLDAWMEERLEKEAQRERMRQHARAPTKRKFWGR